MPRSNLRALSNLTENTERDGSRSGNNNNQSANGRNAQNGTSRGHAVSQGESRQNNQSPPESRRNSQNQAASRHTGQSQVELGQRSTNQVTGRETPARSTSLRETLDGSQYRHSDMSQRSPAISRTPSADRRLLRTLTVSPNADEINEYDDPTPASAYTPKQTQSRQGGSHYSTNRTPTGTPNRNSISRTPSENGGGRVTVQIPETSDTRGDEWQTNKTVPEANSYMLKYEVACDITFIVGDAKEEIRAHKYMLMARSPILFKSLVKHQGNIDVKIGVPDMKTDIFRDMLQYLYTDEFDIHSDNVTSMLYAAKKFQLKGLTTLCFQYLDAEMHDESVAKIMEQAHIYNETGLYEKCVRYILTNANTVLRKAGIGELCDECVSRIIRSDDLRAPEEAVFEGAITWANAECRRQKKQPTDQNRRQVLGKLLYFIRFPLMDVIYFTQKVSLGNLLSHDETLSIFQFFHGEEQQLPNRFSRTERNRLPRNITENVEPIMLSSRSPSHSRVRRFLTTDGQWKQNGPPDSISFTVTSPIVLYGAEVYGVAKGKETYSLKIFVYDDITREEIRKNDASVFTNSIKETYEVYLTRPLRIPARRVFTLMILMKGSPTHKGIDGERIQIVDGVQFEFIDSNRSSNGTDCNVGQIAGLLFNKTQ